MIEFRQKIFSEYDAMRSLYVELMKRGGDRNKWKVIDQSSLIPILRGNNVVVERFVISTSFLHRDRYRLYLKIGAKAKLPDEVRLPEKVYDKKLGNATLNINVGNFAPDKGGNNNNNNQQKNFSEVTFRQKEFKGAPPTISATISPSINLTYEVRELLGDAVKYDKKERSLVLEFSSIDDAITALNILPFGINYNVFLLV
jgi:hypothetical protein